jgi:hypothetical protein
VSASSHSQILELILIWGLPTALLALGTWSLVRGGPSSIGGALTISSVVSLAFGLGAVWLIRLTGSTPFAKAVTLLPTVLTLVALVGTMFILRRGRYRSLGRITVAVALVALPVLAVVLVVQQLVYCRLDLCINL